MNQFCGQCGKRMSRREDGAWHGCCDNLGYWADLSILPRDKWYPVATQRDGLTLFVGPKWGAEQRAVFPNQSE